MGLFGFFSGKKDNFGTLVKYYEEYAKSCTLQPIIFPQMAFLFNNKMDVINGEVVEKDNYLAQFNRLIDVIRLGDIKDTYGREKVINLVQEIYLRIVTASWIMSKLNSYDDFGKRMRNEMNMGYKQTIFSVNFRIINNSSWKVECCAQLFKNDFDVSEINLDGTININLNTFDSQDPFSSYIIFENTPKKLLRTFYDLIRWLFFQTPTLTNVNQNNMTIGRVYADFWLKKMIVTITMSSGEWYFDIRERENIVGIENIEYNLLDDRPYVKRIRFKFNLKLKNSKRVELDYEYSIPSAEAFNQKYVDSLANFVSINHNLSN